MKKLLFAFLLFLFLPLQVFAVIPRSDDYFVTDGARLLKNDTISYMVQASNILYKLELIEYNVVTISDLGDVEMEEYADQIFEKYPISDNGMLILVARGNGLLRVQVGSDLATFIDEDVIDDYIDRYFTPYIEAGDWDKGLKNGYNSFYKLICEHYNLDASNIELLEDVDFKTKYSEYIIIGLSILATIFAVVLLEMYRNIFIRRRYHDTIFDYIMVAVIMILNVALLVFCYLLKPMSFLIVLFVEGVSLYSFYHNQFDLFTLKHFKIMDKSVIEKKKKEKEEKKESKKEEKKEEKKEIKKKVYYSDDDIKRQILADQKIKENIMQEHKLTKKVEKEKKIRLIKEKDNRY